MTTFFLSEEFAPRVLYIGRQHEDFRLLEQGLGRWPEIQFLHAPDGRGLAALRQAPTPHVVLIDMPPFSTAEPDASAAVRLESLPAGTRTVALWPADGSGQDHAAPCAGADDVWFTPLDAEAVAHDIVHALSQAHGLRL